MESNDIYVLKKLKSDLQAELKKVVKEGTSINGNRLKYRKLRSRIARLNRWIKELGTNKNHLIIKHK